MSKKFFIIAICAATSVCVAIGVFINRTNKANEKPIGDVIIDTKDDLKATNDSDVIKINETNKILETKENDSTTIDTETTNTEEIYVEPIEEKHETENTTSQNIDNEIQESNTNTEINKVTKPSVTTEQNVSSETKPNNNNNSPKDGETKTENGKNYEWDSILGIWIEVLDGGGAIGEYYPPAEGEENVIVD